MAVTTLELLATPLAAPAMVGLAVLANRAKVNAAGLTLALPVLATLAAVFGMPRAAYWIGALSGFAAALTIYVVRFLRESVIELSKIPELKKLRDAQPPAAKSLPDPNPVLIAAAVALSVGLFAWAMHAGRTSLAMIIVWIQLAVGILGGGWLTNNLYRKYPTEWIVMVNPWLLATRKPTQAPQAPPPATRAPPKQAPK